MMMQWRFFSWYNAEYRSGRFTTTKPAKPFGKTTNEPEVYYQWQNMTGILFWLSD